MCNKGVENSMIEDKGEDLEIRDVSRKDVQEL